MDNETEVLINEMGNYAHQLHMLLKERDCEPQHHKYMVENRGLQPCDPQFYNHIHPVEDLLAYLEDPHANDDPIDQTIGEGFEFRIYSRRWGHKDTYKIKRTENGWIVDFPLIGGPCDKGGRPFLFENFHHDSIQYPNALDSWMKWLWEQAASKGLSKEQVQTALQELADWVNNTEKNTPSHGVWESYC
ncbi:hypothetical protein [Methanosarcina barkeri]|nr:hypothetical protein [Methanosarcina barkeri]